MTPEELNRSHESERGRIHAVAKMRRFRTIIEYVAQMRGAFGARNCGPDHPEGRVSFSSNVLRRDRCPEARPSRSGIELCV